MLCIYINLLFLSVGICCLSAALGSIIGAGNLFGSNPGMISYWVTRLFYGINSFKLSNFLNSLHRAIILTSPVIKSLSKSNNKSLGDPTYSFILLASFPN